MALDFAAGCVGGCAGLMVGYPLDTIKVHIQTQDHRNPKFKGTWHCFRTILARDSVSGLYRGMTSPMAGVAVVNAIVFGVYGQTQRNFADQDHIMTHFLAGASAGLAQSPVCSPLELAKTRLQLQSQVDSRFTGPIHCLRHVYRHEGHRGIFNGLGITAIREAPSYGVYFLTYEALTRTTKIGEISTFHMLMAGGFAGTASWVATYPVDVIKSRLQADYQGRYSGAVDCLKQSVESEGYKWLFRGLNSTIIRAFPTNAATFAVVTWTFRIFGEDKVNDPEQPEVKSKNLRNNSTILMDNGLEESRETFVNKCSSLVAKVTDEYSYESRNYYSANGITLFENDDTKVGKKIDRSFEIRRNDFCSDEKNDKKIENISSNEEIDDSTNEAKPVDKGG